MFLARFFLCLFFSLLFMSRSFADHAKQNSARIETERAAYLSKKRLDLIHEVKNALRFVKTQDQTDHLQLKLANLFIEESKYLSERPNEASAYLKKAQGILLDLSRRTPACKKRDEVLFLLGQGFSELGQKEPAKTTFQQLLNEYPKSPFVEDATLNLAESAFEESRFELANRYFQKIIQNRESPLILYAHYKMGWSHLNLKNLVQSLYHFKAVALEEETGAISNALTLKREAIRDLCLPFSELKQYEEGASFFSEQGEPFTRSGYECLASKAQENGDFESAISLNLTLLQMDSHHKHNPKYSLALVEICRKQNRWEAALSALDEGLSSFVGDSTWREVFSTEPVTIEEIQRQFETVARTFGLEAHAIAQKTKNADFYRTAKVFYELYLKHFSHSLEGVKIRFYLAEIYYKDKDYEKAIEAYTEVFRSRQASSSIRQESLRAAVLASFWQIKQEGSATELTDSESLFLKLVDQFTEAFPKDLKTPQFMFQAHYLRYERNQYDSAQKGFWSLIRTFPESEVSQKASLLLLDILNQKKDYEKLIETCKSLKQIPQIASGKSFKDISDVLRKSELKRVELMEQAGNHLEAGKAYLAYMETYGSEDPSLNQQALFNAGACFNKANHLAEATRLQEQFLKRFPQSSLRKELLLQVAKSFEAMAELGQAAYYFSLFQKEFPSHSQSAEALRLAGLYFWGNGNPRLSETSFLKLIESYPVMREMAEKDLLELYTSQGDYKKEFDFLSHARNQKGISFSRYLDLTLRLADLQETRFQKPALALFKEAESLTDKYRSVILTSPQGPELIARVLLRRALSHKKEFDSIPLSLPQAALERSLAKKMRLLTELEKEFGDVAALGGELGLASLSSMAQVFSDFAQEIDSAPVPRDLDAEQIDIYRDELSKQLIQPILQKASTFSNQCLAQANLLSLPSPLSDQCHQQTNAKVTTFSLPPFFWAQESDLKSSLESLALYRDSLKDKPFSESEIRARVLSLQPLLQTEKENYPEISKLKEVDTKEEALALFNRLRLENPPEAIRKIRNYLKTKSQEPVFHQLLALAFLDQGEVDRAKITLLSLLARGDQSSALLNNLGVIEATRGHRKSASNFFAEAQEKGSSEALLNQGFMALTLGNGALAKSLFEKGLTSTRESLAKMGLAISKIQTEDLEGGKEDLEELKKEYPSHPLVQKQFLSLSETASSHRQISSDLEIQIR